MTPTTPPTAPPPGPHTAVYCVTANDENFYAEMAAVSAWLLRRVSPGVRLVVLMDEVTAGRPPRRLGALLDLADGHRTVHTGDDRAVVRSRLLKIRARREVTGDFVFLDADTLPVRPIEALFEAPGDIAGVIDPEAHAYTTPPDPLPAVMRELNWQPVSADIYLNGGVLLQRDRPIVHEASRRWEQMYLRLAQAGRFTDQQPLAQTLHALHVEVGHIPGRFNAMVHARGGHRTVRNAAIIHVWISLMGKDGPAGKGPKTVLHAGASHLKDTGTFDTERLERLLATGNPWLGPPRLRHALALGWYGHAARRAGRIVLERLRLVTPE